MRSELEYLFLKREHIPKWEVIETIIIWFNCIRISRKCGFETCIMSNSNFGKTQYSLIFTRFLVILSFWANAYLLRKFKLAASFHTFFRKQYPFIAEISNFVNILYTRIIFEVWEGPRVNYAFNELDLENSNATNYSKLIAQWEVIGTIIPWLDLTFHWFPGNADSIFVFLSLFHMICQSQTCIATWYPV